MDTEIVKNEKHLKTMDDKIKTIKATNSLHNLAYGLFIR